MKPLVRPVPWAAKGGWTTISPLHPSRNDLRMVGSHQREPPAMGALTPDQQQDLELIRAVARHDRRAFEMLYYRHSPRLHQPERTV